MHPCEKDGDKEFVTLPHIYDHDDFFGLHASLPMKICKLIIFKVFSPLMREILHAWWDFFHLCGTFYMLGGRNSVQAGDSLSVRESWKPCAQG